MPPNSRPPHKGDHIFLVDGSSYIFRAYFQSMNQDAKYNYRSDGVATGAVRMFCAMLLRLLTEMKPEERPTHLAVVFDKSEHTFRNELYPDYKAHRPDAPADLVPQFKLIREAVHAFDLPCLEQAGFEADDLIATYVREASELGATSTIVSSDKDLMQLVTDRVTMYDTMKDRRIGPAEVMEKFGVLPDKVIEVQALIGDSTDNVPGVPGIGPKTAAQLIGEFGDLETLLARAGEIKQQKRRETLIENADNARLSKTLVTLDTKVPLDVPLADLAVHHLDARRLIAYLKAMEFSALVRRVADVYKVDAAEIEPDGALRAGAAAAAEPAAQPTAATPRQGELALGSTEPPVAKRPASTAAPPAGGATPQAHAESRIAAAKATPFDRARYETVRTVDELRVWVARAIDAGVVAIDTETTSLDPMQAELCGFSLAVGANAACYVPLIHRQGGDGTGLFPGEVVAAQMTVAEALAVLKPLLEDKGVLKIGQNLKYDWQVLSRHGIEIASFDDTMLMSYVLDAGRRAHGMDPMAEQWLNHRTIRYGEVAGTGKAKQRFENVSIQKATEYAAEDADVTLRLWQVLKARLPAEHMTRVYETLERPLIPVLARMERQGISIDRTMLARLSGEFAQEAMGLEEEIRQLAGEPLNPGSPKQLGDILFGKMGLAEAVGAKKTKTGAWSTSASVLEDLAELGHALPQKILEWRQVAKLRSTYTDALPSYVNPETGRVHTNYALAATTTGRLSSSEPNLQNIPIRTEEGRKIRRAFIAAPGHKLVSADYSQIELRLLAEIADIPVLKDAFLNGLDIHAMTASEMFGVPIAGMPGEVRRRAKAINFGIIYGISAFGLANQLGIPREEAGAYIRKYFERFPGIRAYMDATREFCRKNGYVTTIFGRKCHYPDITASNPSIRSFNERAAINARLQGSAADIIRRAMIRMDDALAKERLAARMLLQVHDELIFEVPDSEVEPTLRLVKHVMEEAPKPAVALSVPLQVDARAADNWDEAH
jgi:DNA polymerase I